MVQMLSNATRTQMLFILPFLTCWLCVHVFPMKLWASHPGPRHLWERASPVTHLHFFRKAQVVFLARTVSHGYPREAEIAVVFQGMYTLLNGTKSGSFIKGRGSSHPNLYEWAFKLLYCTGVLWLQATEIDSDLNKKKGVWVFTNFRISWTTRPWKGQE